MSHTYAQNTVHLVFSTKERRKDLVNGWLPEVASYVGGICKNHGIFIHAIGGAEDHLHLLIQVPPVLPLAKAVAGIKANSSRWAHQKGRRLAWQEGYAAFSVSASIVPAVVEYIENQTKHHRKRTFRDELIALLRKHKVDFDPRYVFG
jgi:REP element-mobilizing transposase RayT